jgi:hypothetical protein
MPSQGANGSRWRAGRAGRGGRNGAEIDHQPDRRDQIEAAIQWIQTRQALFKRIAALQARIDRLRARKNGKIRAPRVASLLQGHSRRRT